MSSATPSKEFLLLSRGHWDPAKPAAEIQAAIDGFYAWHRQLVEEGKFRPGQRLAKETRLVTSTGIKDGPFTEAKEVVGGYWFILAGSLDEAARIAARNPCLACGLSFEIRPLELEPASAWRESSETPPSG